MGEPAEVSFAPGKASPSAYNPPIVTALSRILGRGLAFTVAGLLALLAVVAAAETLLWLAFHLSWAASAEIQGTLLVWLALLAAAWGVGERLHLGVDLVVRRLTPSLQATCHRLAAGLVLSFGVLFAFFGARLVAVTTNTLPATGVGAWVQYLPAPVAGALISIFALERLVAGGWVIAETTAPAHQAPGRDE